MRLRWWSWRDRCAVLAALVVPLAVCLLLLPFRTDVPNTDAALILVAAVVAVSAFGHRLAGVVASTSGAVWFDFLLTAPYERLSIGSRDDIETFVLVLVVGLAVTELAVRGRLSRVLAVTDERYLEAIGTTSALLDAGAERREVTTHVSEQLSGLLGLTACRFEASRLGGMPRLDTDGCVRTREGLWDLDQHGFPERDVEIVASSGRRMQGRFVITPVAGTVPTAAALRCAVIVVGLGAAALAGLDQPV